jgi:predicted nucleic acid-binding Zn ribbon protein
MTASGPFDSLGTILSGLAKRLGLESRLLELRLQRQWLDIVGEPIGSHTWPGQIRFKKLYLTVQNSVWLQQLTFLKPTLLEKLNREAGKELITEIVLRVGELPALDSGTDSTAQPSPRSPVSEIGLAEASAHAASVQDPELRARLAQVMAEALSRPEPR